MSIPQSLNLLISASIYFAIHSYSLSHKNSH